MAYDSRLRGIVRRGGTIDRPAADDWPANESHGDDLEMNLRGGKALADVPRLRSFKVAPVNSVEGRATKVKKPNAKTRTPKLKDDQVILLKDLAPRSDVKGGAGKLFFGEHIDVGDDLSTEINPGKKSQQ